MLWWNTSDVELMLHHITKSMYHFDHKFTSYYYDPSFDKQLTPEILRNASSPQRGSIIVVWSSRSSPRPSKILSDYGQIMGQESSN